RRAVRTRQAPARASRWRGFRRGSDADARAKATAATRSWLGSAPLPRTLLGAVMSFLEAVGVAFDGDDFGVVNEAVNQRDDAGGVGEHLAPFGEWPVGGDQRALALITPRDQFEHEVGMAVGIGEIPDFVDHQQLRARIVAQAASQRGIAIERAKVAEQLARAGEQDRVPLDQRLVSDVLRQGRLADAVGTDDDDIGGLLEEVERHQRLDGGSVAALGPVPVEVAQRLEAADMSGLQPPFQAAAGALLLFPIE